MLPRELVDRVSTPDGHQLELWRHGDSFLIAIDRCDLMLSRVHGSEVDLATLALDTLGARPSPRVLVGGLGMGFTIRGTLDALGARPATVVVAEAFSRVVEWNRGVLAPVAGRPLDDPRVRVVVVDVADLVARPSRAGARGQSGDGPPFDAILLDVDNGPEALTLASNDRLYSGAGVERLHRALSPGGVLAVWSTVEDPEFIRRLRAAGFTARTQRVRARAGGKGGRYWIFLAQRA